MKQEAKHHIGGGELITDKEREQVQSNSSTYNNPFRLNTIFRVAPSKLEVKRHDQKKQTQQVPRYLQTVCECGGFKLSQVPPSKFDDLIGYVQDFWGWKQDKFEVADLRVVFEELHQKKAHNLKYVLLSPQKYEYFKTI